MVTYDFKCKDCGVEEEAVQLPSSCRHCQSTQMKRVYAVGFNIKSVDWGH